MENLTKALQQYLLAKNQDPKATQVALDSMTSAIKADIVSTIETVIKDAVETEITPETLSEPRNSLAARLHAKNSVENRFA